MLQIDLEEKNSKLGEKSKLREKLIKNLKNVIQSINYSIINQ